MIIRFQQKLLFDCTCRTCSEGTKQNMQRKQGAPGPFAGFRSCELFLFANSKSGELTVGNRFVSISFQRYFRQIEAKPHNLEVDLFAILRWALKARWQGRHNTPVSRRAACFLVRLKPVSSPPDSRRRRAGKSPPETRPGRGEGAALLVVAAIIITIIIMIVISSTSTSM